MDKNTGRGWGEKKEDRGGGGGNEVVSTFEDREKNDVSGCSYWLHNVMGQFFECCLTLTFCRCHD